MSGPGGGPRAARRQEIDLRDGVAVPPSQRLSVEWLQGSPPAAGTSTAAALPPGAPPSVDPEPWAELLDAPGDGSRTTLRRVSSVVWWVAAGLTLVVLAAVVWLAATAWQAGNALQQARSQLPVVLTAVRDGDPTAAAAVGSVTDRAQLAYDATHDPVWSLAARIPVAGARCTQSSGSPR